MFADLCHITVFFFFFFFFNDTATTEIYTLSLHDALPISTACMARIVKAEQGKSTLTVEMSLSPNKLDYEIKFSSTDFLVVTDRKSTRLNSSHSQISYAVFCLKKKTNKKSDNVINSISTTH